MNHIEVYKWKNCFQGPLTEANLENYFQPPELYRISGRRYPVGAAFQGMMRRGQCFVMNGSCKISFTNRLASQEATLSTGDFAELPEGDYELFSVGDEDLYLTYVWMLRHDR